MDGQLAIIIVNWNAWRYTVACLESIKAAEGIWLVIVVDNGSSDGSLDRIRQWALENSKVGDTPGATNERKLALVAEYTADEVLAETNCDQVIGAGLVLIRSNDNLGFVGANNLGIRYALRLGVRYVLLLNNDAVVGPSTLRSLLKTIERFPDAGIVGPLLLSEDGMSIQSCGVIRRWALGPVHKRRVNWKHAQCDAVSGAAMLVRKEVFDSVGLLDERFFFYHEETDFCYRATRTGFRVVLDCDAVVYHRGGASTGGRASPVVQYYAARNLLLLIRKHGSRLELAVALVIQLVKAAFRAVEWLVSGRPDLVLARVFGVADFMLGRFGRSGRWGE